MGQLDAIAPQHAQELLRLLVRDQVLTTRTMPAPAPPSSALATWFTSQAGSHGSAEDARSETFYFIDPARCFTAVVVPPHRPA